MGKTTGKMVVYTYIMIDKNKSKRLTLVTHNWVTYEEALALLADMRTANESNGYMKAHDIHAEWQSDPVSM